MIVARAAGESPARRQEVETVQLVPINLEGEHVRLEPLRPAHAPDLWRATLDTEVWPWMPIRAASEVELHKLIERTVELAGGGAALGLAILALPERVPIGATGYWNVVPEHRRLEIGMTWITRRFQRTVVNTECKYLLLRHAFERLGCIRVEFKTDSRNVRSRAALHGIGATEEGTLRCHMILPDGRLRDSVYFSIVESEWPAVKARLEARMARLRRVAPDPDQS